jgi:hypothetical protein
MTTSKAKFIEEIEKVLKPRLSSIKPPVTDDRKDIFVKSFAKFLFNNQEKPGRGVLPDLTEDRRQKLKQMQKACERLSKTIASMDMEFGLNLTMEYCVQVDTPRSYDFPHYLQRFYTALENTEIKIKGKRTDRWKWEKAVFMGLYMSYNTHLGRPTYTGAFRGLAEWAVERITGNALGDTVFRKSMVYFKGISQESPGARPSK